MSDYISTDRLDIYEKHLKISKSQIMAAYHWNKSLSGAMFPAMQCLEVTLRNALDHAVRTTPKMGSNGLWNADPNWITNLTKYMGNKSIRDKRKRYKVAKSHKDPQDPQGFYLDKYGKRVIDKKISEEVIIDQVKSRIKKEGKLATPERLIAGLNLGFWTTLLSDKYEDNHSKQLLWPNITRIVFPNAPSNYSINDIRQRIEKIRELRNRLSHHEALWKFHYDDPITNKPDYNNPVYGTNASINLLRKHYDDIIELIGWINLERKNTFIAHSGNLRFKSLCSIDGLNSYIEHDKIKNKINFNRSRGCLRKILKKLEKEEFIRVVKDRDTIFILGPDNSIFIS
ncbi:TPA: Abi family protein [Providencia rettgeri]